MARMIIIGKAAEDPAVRFHRTVYYWADVPAGKEAHYADAGAESQVPDITQAELGAIQDGSVRETATTVSFPPGTTQAVIDANLIAGQAAWQAMVNADATLFDGSGKYWNGSDWVTP